MPLWSVAGSALGADRVAVGHTRDDQAETVLLRLLRGAGPRGLAGIYPRNGAIVRPLFDVDRQQLRAWSADNGITHVEDASNQDLPNPRNLLRHEVLPALQGWFGASVPDACWPVLPRWPGPTRSSWPS